jgi:Protein of unknown function (DUF2442)
MASRTEFEVATRRAKRKQAVFPAATSARYDRRLDRVMVGLSSGIELAFPPHKAQGLETAKPSQLHPIEISPSGFGIHFPKLDADLYIPALIEGFFGSKRWMASRLGASGGRAKSRVKASASRRNGRLGGRPKKSTVR